MVEAKRYLQVANLDINDINYVLQQIQDRLDQIEGYRGVPTFLQAPVGQTAGDSSEIPILGQLTSVINALGEIYPPTYGEMKISEDTDLTLTTQDTWYQIVGFSAGHEDNVEFDNTYQQMVLPAGDYILMCWIGCGVTGNNQDLEFGFFADDVQILHASTARRFATADIGSISFGGVDEVTEGGKVTVKVRNITSAGKTFTTSKCTVIVYRVHK